MLLPLALMLAASVAAAEEPLRAPYFSKSTPPTGLGPLKFDMSAAQAKKLCQGEWVVQEIDDDWRIHNPTDAYFTCKDMPMKVGFNGYEVGIGFIKNGLVEISLTKALGRISSFARDPYKHTRDALIRRYGNAPVRRSENEYYKTESYTWSFPLRNNPKRASDVMVHHRKETDEPLPTMHLRYRSDRHRVEARKLRERQHREHIEETEGAF